MGEVAKKSNIPFWRQCFVTASVCVNIISHGAVIGSSAILIPALRRPESHIKATVSEESTIASIVGIALIVGNLVVTPMMGPLGRKKSHLLTIPPIMTGWFLMIMANSVTELIIARFLQGVSMGMLGPLGSIIVAEMTHPKNRGAFLTGVSLSLTLGVLFSHTMGTYLSWQQVSLISSMITFTSLCMVIFAPESPPWLVTKSRYDEAREVFQWLRGENEDQDELESMIKAQNMIRKSSVAGQDLPFGVRFRRAIRYTRETFRKPEFYKPIMIMCLLYITFQFSGINVISSYATDIIRQVVGPEANAKMLMVAMDVQRLICNILAVFVMRACKRRLVLFSSGTVCVLAYFTKGAYVYAKQNSMLPAALEGQWFPILLLAVYMFSLTMGITSVPFAVSGEVFPLAFRGLGGGLSVLPLSLNFFIAVKCFPTLTESVGLPITYFMYGTVVFVCLAIVFFMLPETKDKTLQEIEETFKGVSERDRRASAPLTPNEAALMMRRTSSVILY